MTEILSNLQNKLQELGASNEQIQQTISKVDLSQINLQDIPATQEYLTGLFQELNFSPDLASNLVQSFTNSLVIPEEATNLADQATNLFGINLSEIPIIGDFFGGK